MNVVPSRCLLGYLLQILHSDRDFPDRLGSTTYKGQSSVGQPWKRSQIKVIEP